MNTLPRRHAYDGLKALESGELAEAKRQFNLALKYNIRNSYLQFFTGLTYHLLGLEGSDQDFDLARTGYRLAQQFDQSNWHAVFYEGLLLKDMQKFDQAQATFARALLLEPTDPETLYLLAETSYYARDLKTALASLKQLEKLDLSDEMKERFSQTAAIVHAGANLPDQAAHYYDLYLNQAPRERRAAHVERRLKAWTRFHDRVLRKGQGFGGEGFGGQEGSDRVDGSRGEGLLQKAQFALPEEDKTAPAFDNATKPTTVEEPKVVPRAADALSDTTSPSDPTSFFSSPNTSDSSTDANAAAETNDRDDWFSSPSGDSERSFDGEVTEGEREAAPKETVEDRNPMVVVDVVILRTEDDNTTSKGVNLLNGLKIQFGDPLSNTPGFSFGREKSKDLVDPDDTVNTRTITRLISFPSVSYSLNIANAASGRNEILARPTLVAMPGETSEFFSGVEVAAAAVSGGQGDSVSIDKEIGVKLSVTPEILEDDFVRLEVEAERTFLTQPSSSIIFEFRLDTTKTSVNAAVTLGFGQTLILGGLSEREKEGNRDGVPFLQDLPGIQYLFSKATTRDFNKSVLILITPRRALTIDKSPEEFEERLEKMTGRERDIERLSYEYRDWFTPTPNVDSVFQHMQDNELYREFKTGDFPLENWRGKQGHFSRLRDALGYIYY
ncbi:MAG: hypothetical protein ACPGOV_15060 [Magnetovibrionaceae bacterium]